VLAFTSVGVGPKSSIKVERTKEDGNTNRYFDNKLQSSDFPNAQTFEDVYVHIEHMYG